MVAANVRDVAALARVSVGTVSNVLNGTKKVAPDTHARVLAAIETLGFVRNDAARQLRVGQSRMVGMMVLDIGNPFFTDLARGVEDRLGTHSRSLMLSNSAEDADREASHLSLFEEQRVAGLLITPVSRSTEGLERLRSRGTPVVLVDRFGDIGNFSSVSVDDRLGGRLAMQHLLDIGRTKPAFIGGQTDTVQVSERLSGARLALAEAGRRPLRVLERQFMSADAGRDAAENLLALTKAERPDSIFAANDLVALGVLQALTRAGVRVPDDIALIGYDDIYFAASAAVPLSSVRQPTGQMGQAAADLLIAEIDKTAASALQNVVFAPELVVRESTLATS